MIRRRRTEISRTSRRRSDHPKTNAPIDPQTRVLKVNKDHVKRLALNLKRYLLAQQLRKRKKEEVAQILWMRTPIWTGLYVL